MEFRSLNSSLLDLRPPTHRYRGAGSKAVRDLDPCQISMFPDSHNIVSHLKRPPPGLQLKSTATNGKWLTEVHSTTLFRGRRYQRVSEWQRVRTDSQAICHMVAHPLKWIMLVVWFFVTLLAVRVAS